MFEKAEVLDREKHASLRFKPVTDFRFMRSVIGGPVASSEMRKAAREYPIVFPTVGRHLPLAQFGVHEKMNAFVDADNKWLGEYIPAHVRRYPFVLGDKGNGTDFFVMADLRGLSSDSTAEALFGKKDAEGAAEQDVVERATEFLVNFEQELLATQALVEPLYEKDVLVAKTVTLQKPGMNDARVSGFQIVDRDRLRALDDVTIAAWERSGLLDLVSLHLASQENWVRLLR
jgi:hypothetical protein